MKRLILKLAFVILLVLGLFILYLLTCFPLFNTTVFSWEENKGSQENRTHSSGNKNGSENISGGGNVDTNNSSGSSGINNDTFNFNFENPVSPEISDYIIVSITAKNTGPAKYPYGSIAINLSEENIGLVNSAAPGSEVDGIRDSQSDSVKYSKTDDNSDAKADDFKSSGADNVKDGGAADSINDEKAAGVKDYKALSENSKTGSITGINITGSPGTYKIQERTRIFVDGIQHNYYIAVGENKYWRYDWNLSGPTLKGQISSLEIETPKIEGVDIQINSVSLNKRLVFAADSHINYFFKNYFQLSYVDRYLTPAYVFLILFTAVFFPFGFLLKRTRGSDEGTKTNDLESGDLKSPDLKDRNSSVKTVNANNIYAGNLDSNIEKIIGDALKSNRLTDTRISFKTLALLVPLLLLIFFSFYFINNYIFTVKGYWDSYKQYIISGRFDETYYGFSDFEKFVTWVEEKVPQGQNVIVLVKGEPVYIMAQMAYGLYPRDIKFLNISSLSAGEIADEITRINFAYEYIVVLSETDKAFLKSVKVKLEYSYRENAGFIYKLILK